MATASQKQERDGAKKWGGTVNAGSGNTWLRKNDVRTQLFSIEYKVTSKASYALTAEAVRQARKIALLDNRIMLFGIRMDGLDLIVIEEADLLSLVGDG